MANVLSVSAILNSLSVIITSPYWTYFRKFEFSVINWSLALPPHHFEMKQIVPGMVIPMRNFAVLRLLYVDHVSAHALNLLGWLICSSKQSIFNQFSCLFWICCDKKKLAVSQGFWNCYIAKKELGYYHFWLWRCQQNLTIWPKLLWCQEYLTKSWRYNHWNKWYNT